MPFLCRACQRVGTDQEFFRHHISDRQVIVHPLDGSKPFELHRNRTSGGEWRGKDDFKSLISLRNLK
jgi:hypothetical protein